VFCPKAKYLALKVIWCSLVCLISPTKYQFMWMSDQNVRHVNVVQSFQSAAILYQNSRYG